MGYVAIVFVILALVTILITRPVKQLVALA
jgi:hypothetical protein